MGSGAGTCAEMLARLKQELKSELCWRKVRQWGRQWGWAARGLGGTRLPHSAPAAPPHPAAPQPASSLLALPSACSTAASPVTAAPSRTRCCARTACRRSCTKTGGGCWRWEVRAPRQAWGTNCLLAFPLPVSLPIVIFHAPAWLLSPRPLPPHCAPPLCPPTVPPHCAPPLCPPRAAERYQLSGGEGSRAAGVASLERCKLVRRGEGS